MLDKEYIVLVKCVGVYIFILCDIYKMFKKIIYCAFYYIQHTKHLIDHVYNRIHVDVYMLT